MEVAIQSGGLRRPNHQNVANTNKMLWMQLLDDSSSEDETMPEPANRIKRKANDEPEEKSRREC